MNESKSNGTPGPNAYRCVDYDKIKRSMPSYTISPRYKPKKSGEPSPGPAEYSPKLPKGPAGYTFGGRTFRIPLITPADAMRKRQSN